MSNEILTDDQLLWFAAKASGVDTRVLAYDNDGSAGHWNPLIHCGDAFRLMSKLQMQVAYLERGYQQQGIVCVTAGPNIIVVEEKQGDVDAATRRAIVRAAAEIGRPMP